MLQVPDLFTERLRLRGWRSDDLDGVADLLADPDVARFLTRDGRPADRTQSWRYLALYAGHWALRGYGPFAVEDRATGAFLGRVGPWRPDGWPGFEIGWGLKRSAWGKGLAFEASVAAGRWAFETFGLGEVVSLIRADNERSARLARRLGAKPDDQPWSVDPAFVVWRAQRRDWPGAG